MTTNEVAKISGVTVRTLHHYDDIGLLSPKRNPENMYRRYSNKDLDTLQQILFFRECGFKLSEINLILNDSRIDRLRVYEIQEKYLLEEKKRIQSMLKTLEKSMRALKGEINMTSDEKFDVFKQELVRKNEEEFGKELQKLYPDHQIEKSNENLLDMSKSDYEKQVDMAVEILDVLQAGMKSPENTELAKNAASLHRAWLKLMWGDSVEYTKEAHLSLIDTYMSDARFIEYYGGTQAIVYLKLAVDRFID